MLDFILVGYFHWGATGAAIATVTAQGVSFGIALWFLYRHGFHFDFSRKDIRLNRNLSKKIMVLGAPIALRCHQFPADRIDDCDWYRYSGTQGDEGTTGRGFA